MSKEYNPENSNPPFFRSVTLKDGSVNYGNGIIGPSANEIDRLNEKIEIKPEEIGLRKALFCVKMFDIFSSAPQKYLEQENLSYSDLDLSSLGIGRKRNQTMRALKRGIYDLYFAKEDSQKMVEFKQKWGEKGKIIENMLEENIFPLEMAKEESLDGDGKAGILQRLKIATDANRILSRGDLDKDQKTYFLKEIGYSSDEAKNIVTGLTTSFFVGNGLSFGYNTLRVFLIAKEFQNPIFNNVDINALLALGAAIVINESTAALNVYMDKRMLDKKAFWSGSANLTATSLYYIFNKLLPSYEKAKTPTIAALSMAFSASTDIAGGTASFSSGKILSMLLAKDLGDSFLHLIESAAKEIMIRNSEKIKNTSLCTKSYIKKMTTETKEKMKEITLFRKR